MPATIERPEFESITLPQGSHASVCLKRSADANGIIRPEMSIMVIDAYRYQRELTIALRHRPGNLSELFWEVHAYKHPGQRCISEVSESVARRLWDRIEHLARQYSTLLFAIDSERGPRCEGFVHFHDRLLAGETPSCKMLA